MKLHPDCEALAFLLGTWKGTGEGHYPTIEPFHYNEEVAFAHVGKPFLSYAQRTKHRDTGEPLHAEAGYLRAVGNDSIELVVVQPSGIVEMHSGVVADHRLELTMSSVQTTASAKSVTAVQRTMWVHGAEGARTLSYDVSMAAVGQELTHHLHANLAHG